NRTWIGAYSPNGVRVTTGNENVILNGDAGQSVLFFRGNIRYITVDNLKFDGGGDQDSSGNGKFVIVLSYNQSDGVGASHIRIKNTDAYHSATCVGAAVYVASPAQFIGQGASYNEFINLSVHDNGNNPGPVCAAPPAHGFYVGSDYNVFDGLRVYRNGQNG